MDRATQISDTLRPTIEAMEVELWGIEYLMQGKQSTLRIFIEKESGVGIDDCEKVSRQVSALMDVEDIIPEAYTLEVSSPGLDRLLFDKSHYDICAGSLVKIRLKMNYQGRRNYKGRLVGIEGDEVVLRLDEKEEMLFPLETIDKAQVVPEFN